MLFSNHIVKHDHELDPSVGLRSLTAALASDALAGTVEQVNGTFSIPYRGDAEAASTLLAALIRGGVKVASFTRRREGLEEIFLKVGAKELS